MELKNPVKTLTWGEERVLRHLWEGLSNREIAQALKIAPEQVKRHVMRIGRKMGIDTRKHLLRIRIVYLFARQRGMI